MIASGPSSTSRKGSTSSILAPIPLKRRSGGRACSPRRTPTRSICPPTSCRLICIYLLHDVSARRSLERRVSLAARRGRCRRHLAGAGLDPIEPVRPPAAAVLCRSLEPRLRALCARRTAGPEARLGIAGRIEQALDMAAVGEHEGAALAVEPRRAVAALPRRDVIGQAGDDVAVKVDAGACRAACRTP